MELICHQNCFQVQLKVTFIWKHCCINSTYMPVIQLIELPALFRCTSFLFLLKFAVLFSFSAIIIQFSCLMATCKKRKGKFSYFIAKMEICMQNLWPSMWKAIISKLSSLFKEVFSVFPVYRLWELQMWLWKLPAVL